MQVQESRFDVWFAVFLDVLPVLVVIAIILAAIFATGSADDHAGHWPLG